MINIDISEKEQNSLRELHITHFHPVVRRRALALLLKSEVMAHHKIAYTLGVCENTILAYFRMYLQNGISIVDEEIWTVKLTS